MPTSLCDDSTLGLALGLRLGLRLRVRAWARVRAYEEPDHLGGAKMHTESKLAPAPSWLTLESHGKNKVSKVRYSIFTATSL